MPNQEWIQRDAERIKYSYIRRHLWESLRGHLATPESVTRWRKKLAPYLSMLYLIERSSDQAQPTRRWNLNLVWQE